MKKRILSILLCLVMVIGLLPTVALAATGVTDALTLAAALGGDSFATVSGGTVTLQQDVNLTDTISITTGTIVLDLNGFTITGKAGAGAAAISVSGTANVTIKDSGTTGSIVGGTGAYPGHDGGTGLSVSETGTVTMSGGTCKGGVGGDAASTFWGGKGGFGLSVSGSGSVKLSGGTFQGGGGGQGSNAKGTTGKAISAANVSTLISSGYGAYDNAATPVKIADADLAAATYISIQKVPTPAETLAATINAITAGSCKVESDC